MNTWYEKCTFALAAVIYLFFHLRGGRTAGEMAAGTFLQLLTTAPYCIGFTWILTRVISWLHQGRKLPWDRVARIFLAFGIFFGFFFGLYEHAERAEQEQLRLEGQQPAAQAAAGRSRQAACQTIMPISISV